MLYDLGYISRKERRKFEAASTSFNGKRLNMMQYIKKQRWEHEAKAAETALAWLVKESPVHRLDFVLPDLFSAYLSLFASGIGALG
jgi:aryl-alcohol dehydrogenase-like predicted oxidoreductase